MAQAFVSTWVSSTASPPSWAVCTLLMISWLASVTLKSTKPSARSRRLSSNCACEPHCTSPTSTVAACSKVLMTAKCSLKTLGTPCPSMDRYSPWGTSLTSLIMRLERGSGFTLACIAPSRSVDGDLAGNLVEEPSGRLKLKLSLGLSARWRSGSLRSGLSPGSLGGQDLAWVGPGGSTPGSSRSLESGLMVIDKAETGGASIRGNAVMDGLL